MFAVLHVGSFALHAALRLRATDRQTAAKPVALFCPTSRPSLVLECTEAARVAGVQVGMTAPQALARCPRLIICPRSETGEAEAAALLRTTALALSPTVEETEIGVCTADLTHAAGLDVLALIENGLTLLHASDLPATAGLGRTPLLALYAAQQLRPPARLLQVTDETAFLAPLPLAVARPSPEIAAVIAHWGLRTLGEFNALPTAELLQRFGAAGAEFCQRCRGGDPRPLRPVAPVHEFRATHESEEPLASLEPLLFLLRRLLDRLEMELRQAGQAAAEIILQLQLEDDRSHAHRTLLPEPAVAAEIMFRALHTHLATLQTTAAITRLTVELVPTRALVRQTGLFEHGLRDPHGFTETLARLAAKIGAERIGSPRQVDSHRPDIFRLVTPPPLLAPPAQPPRHPFLGGPLRRFRPPLPATLEFSAADPKPRYVHTARFAGTITTVVGPWRSSGGWWQPDETWDRTEWDIGLAEGGLYRLLHADGAWFIEGEYD